DAFKAGDPNNVSDLGNVGDLAKVGTLWRGQVTLDKDRAPGQLRVVVREFEHYPSDESVVQNVRVVQHFDDDVSGDNPDTERQFSFTFFPGRARMVFAETIEL